MSVEAEQSILGYSLAVPDKIPELLEIPESWFLRNEHKIIYRAIADLARESLSADMFSVHDHIERQGKSDIAGGMQYLTDLAENSVGSNFGAYKSILLRDYKLSQIASLATELQIQGSQGCKPEDMIEHIQSSLIELLTDHHKGGLKSISSYLDQVLEEMEWRSENPGKMRGRETGFKDLDKTIDGFEDGKVYVLAGRPGMGKTQFGLNLALRIARDAPVCAFSLEMTGKGLSMRALCNESRVFNYKFRNGDLNDSDFDDVAKAVTRLHHNSKLYIDETPGLSVAQMRSRLKAFKLSHGDIGAIVVDHIGLIRKNPAQSDTEGLTAIVHDLARLAKEFDAPVIELAQLNRGVEQRPNKRPLLSDLKQSGAIEEDARVVMFLYRDEYYNQETSDKHITELNIAKNSDGETKTIFFRHNMAIAHYEELINYETHEEETRGRF